ELIGNLKVYEVVLEKDSEISKSKKEKYKSLTLKARKDSSDEEVSCSDSDDEEYAMAEDKKKKEDKWCFKCGDQNHFTSDYPKHSYNDQKAFFVGCWSDSEEYSKKDEICLMALDDNEMPPRRNRVNNKADPAFTAVYFSYSEKEKYEREYKSIRHLPKETSTDFIKRFLRLSGFLGAKACTQEEQAKHFK
nr:zinc finger, CCHC-type, retrotransposon Gag domain protein [Tanacetum cinerariifolium]